VVGNLRPKIWAELSILLKWARLTSEKNRSGLKGVIPNANPASMLMNGQSDINSGQKGENVCLQTSDQ